MDSDKVATLAVAALTVTGKFMQIRIWPKLARKFVRLGAFHFRTGVSQKKKRNTFKK